MADPRTLIDSLRANAERAPEALAMSWQPELAREATQQLSQAQLWRTAQQIAGGLARLPWPVDQPRMALLAFPPGLDFIRAFLGCLRAGVVAVPVTVPRRGRAAQVLEAIAANCAAPLALTSACELPRLRELFAQSPALAAMQLLALDVVEGLGDGEQATAAPGAQDLAFVQYTSGSSSRPKGVCVSHANLAANLALIEREFGITARHLFVNWLPHYHDMGLIGNLLVPIHCGIPSVSMAPAAFIKRPVRWLQAISAQPPGRWVLSGGPNFAYQLCVDRIADQDCEGLSLARWSPAYNGAEPVRVSTMRSFVQRFGRLGFGKRQFLTCYGLAEATLFVTGAHDPEFMSVSGAGLEAGRIEASATEDARPLASSGLADPQRIAIVDPATQRRVPDGQVGEIWVTGPSVPQRYLNDPQQSRRTFEARLSDDAGATRYLATGDVGAVVDGRLYVTGRSKELLIVNGRNLYPHDIEALLQTCDERVESAAVFAWNDPAAQAETVVAVCELARASRHLLPAGPHEEPARELLRIAEALRSAAAAAELAIAHLRFVGPMGIARTSSGKTAYGQLRHEFGTLPGGVRSHPLSAQPRGADQPS
ncbi:fatty acyl-AMP ligase [Caenimonas terrae]|uniref:Fatty acyl-AMP ligase n=1 Tax=Caenimonas terrae TaxID=696074 RepID=A0ABW0NBR6_9BURK